MTTSRLSFMAAALFALVSAAQAGPLTFNTITYSDLTTTQGFTTLNSYSGGGGSAVEVPMPPAAGIYDDTGTNLSPDFFATAQAFQSIPGGAYQPNQYVGFASTVLLTSTSGINATATATNTLQFKFTVNTADNYSFQLGITPAAGAPYAPNFTTTGSFNLEKTSGGDPFSTIHYTYDSASDPLQLGLNIPYASAYFSTGTYLMSIDVTSSILGDVAPAGQPNIYGGGFTFIIPEPASLSLLACGGLLLVTRARNRR